MRSLQILPPVSGALFSSDLCCSDFLLRELLLSYFSVSLSDYHCYGWWFAWHFTPVALVPSWWMENCLMFIYILWTSCFPVWTNLAIIFVHCGFLFRVICTRRILGKWLHFTYSAGQFVVVNCLFGVQTRNTKSIISCLPERQFVHVSGYNKYTQGLKGVLQTFSYAGVIWSQSQSRFYTGVPGWTADAFCCL